MSAQKYIKLPDRYPINPTLLAEFRLLNADLQVDYTDDNTLTISESAYSFEHYEYVEVKFPTSIFADSNFDELYEINDDQLNFEQPGNHSILLKMGTFAIISLMTAGIIISLGGWAKKNRNGRVYTEDAEYHFNKDKKPHEKGGVFMADVSYISYKTTPEEEQKKWKGRILIPPTLSVEIVSAKTGLKPALHKMQDVWMYYGTELGVVVCPFSKKIFVFEKDKAGYIEQSIYEKFTHPLLSDYESDFSEYADEIEWHLCF